MAKIPVPADHKPAETIYRQDVVEAVEGALTSFGSIRAWPSSAQFNLLMSVLGMLSYQLDICLDPRSHQRPKISSTNDAHELVEWIRVTRGAFRCEHLPSFGERCACQQADYLLARADVLPSQ